MMQFMMSMPELIYSVYCICKLKLKCVSSAGDMIIHRFHQNTLGAAFYRGADGCLLVFDVTNDKSVEQLCQW